jgi:hypothetical protein
MREAQEDGTRARWQVQQAGHDGPLEGPLDALTEGLRQSALNIVQGAKQGRDAAAVLEELGRQHHLALRRDEPVGPATCSARLTILYFCRRQNEPMQSACTGVSAK